MSLGLALRSFWAVLTNSDAAERVRQALEPPKPQVTTKVLPVGAIQVLAMLQREGRLIDFLQEDIDSYDDAQVGAAVRDIHRGCRKAMGEHLPLEPVLSHSEGSPCEVPVGFDPASIRLTGNVHGDPPFHGILKHHGWKLQDFQLPQSSLASDSRVVAAAEVEVQ